MKRMKARLQSRSGVSIFYALLFLLVASMVAVVIIDASVTATRRVRDEQRALQATLSLNSGGRLIRDMLQASSVTVRTTEDGDGNIQTVYTAEGPLGSLLQKAVEHVNTLPDAYESHNKDIPGKTTDIIIQVEVDDDPEAVAKVTMEFVMYKEKASEGDVHHMLPYYIDGTITVEGSDEKLRLVAYANSSEFKYTWTVQKLEGGSA